MNQSKKSKFLPLLLIAVVATWLKTYLTYKTSFNLKIDNVMQELILFINPLSFLLFIYGLALFMKTWKGAVRYLLITSSVLTVILYANVVFYRFYSDFITLPVLFQTNNFGDLGSSVTSSLRIHDPLYFADILIIWFAARKLKDVAEYRAVRPMFRRIYFVGAAAMLVLNLGLAETERPQLLTRSFDRELLVKNIGPYNYHLYDIYIQSKSHAQRALADGSELVEVENYTAANHAAPDPDMFGEAEGRNLIVVSMESLQNFVINNDMNGHEVTPFLNSLTQDKDTFYFPNFYHQTGLGKTSDSEFLFENSIYGLGGGAVFFTHGGNTYNSLAERLGENGYSTNVMHANSKSFWNRDMMYKALDIDNFYDIDSYEVGEGQAVNWGMKDIPFFEQSAEHMAEMPQPFYTRLTTLTNHYPFTLDEEDMYIPEYDSNSKTLNRYFQTVRYMDESLKLFFEDLKEKGLYDNSIIVMYGDHYGISENHNKAMSTYLGEEVTPLVSAELQKVPLFIHIPGSGKGENVDTLAGQIDLRPTVLHLLGIETKNDIQFGTDIFSPEHDEFVPFRDGRFVSPDHIFASETCYNLETRSEDDPAACERGIEKTQEELNYSDKVVNGDLLRFYEEKPETGEVKMQEAK
ncbi:LTA synthase family protein [Bhargavaea cecembensis]|uniref:LTA synthase family protein n=1 Tax=Bhargavaea cecembensis TaxID=394098 RepID=UPI000AD3E6D3|nr:LTA synthase family protein [Bhargavaea cecembensis]